jgi:hypothetical protein
VNRRCIANQNVGALVLVDGPSAAEGTAELPVWSWFRLGSEFSGSMESTIVEVTEDIK